MSVRVVFLFRFIILLPSSAPPEEKSGPDVLHNLGYVQSFSEESVAREVLAVKHTFS